jgi:peptide chain release factor 2
MLSLLLEGIIMLIDELQERFKQLEPDVEIIKTFWANSTFDTRLHELEQKAQNPLVWQDPQQSHILKELQALKNQTEQYQALVTGYTEMHELLNLFKDDEQELLKLRQDLGGLEKLIKNFKIQLLLSDWAEILLRMYVRFCEREKLNATLIDHQVGEGAGIKSGTLFVKGKNAYGLLKSEHGIHRLVRISPYDASKRRHTSFAGVHVTPESQNVDILIDQKDLRIDTYRAGGAGGQHVNKTDSAVRITHLPTNIVVQCQSERSQLQNKETSMKMLYAKLAQKAKEEQQEKIAGFEKKKIEWGSQIRSYVLHPYKMVKDHRTDYESPQPDLVLDGELIDFIESYLVKRP